MGTEQKSLKNLKVRQIVSDMSLKGYKPHDIAAFLNESGYVNGNRAYTANKVTGLLKEIKIEWVEQSREDNDLMRAKQLHEIQLVKTALHERKDYRTLSKYIEMERDLLGLKEPEETKWSGELKITVDERVAALSAVSDVERKLLENVEEAYEIIDVEGVVIHEPIESEDA